MALAPNKLGVTSAPIADLTAAALWDMLAAYERQHEANGTTAMIGANLRLVRGHVRQLIELHDELNEADILLEVPAQVPAQLREVGP